MNNKPILVLTLTVLFSVLTTACAPVKQTARKLDPTRELYETFDGKFIAQVEQGKWTPALQQPPHIDSKPPANNHTTPAKKQVQFYIPDGVTMARMDFHGVIDLPSIQKHLNKILIKLLTHSPKTEVNARVIITVGKGYGSASSSPDGYIMIPLELIKSTQSEDEIAWLLGHEVAHIILGHHDSDWVEKYQGKLAAAAESTLTIASTLSKSASKYKANTNLGMAGKAAELYTTTKDSYKVSTEGLLPAWQRNQEDEADLLALDLVAAAGYNIDAGQTVLENMQIWEKSKIATNESSGQDSSQVTDQPHPNHSATEIASKVTNAVGNQIKKIRKSLAREHNSTELRMENLSEYREREYEEHPENELLVKPWEMLLNKPTNKSTLALYQHIWNANTSLHNNDFVKAEQHIIKGVSGVTKYHSMARLVFYDLRKNQGRDKLAMKNLQLALKDKKTSFLIYASIIGNSIDNRKFEDATKYLNQAWEEFKHPPNLYPLKISLAKKRGDQKLALLLVDECRHKAYKISGQCQQAIAE